MPVTGGELKRALDKDRKSLGEYETTEKSVNDAVEDSIIGFWNAMVKSEIGRKNEKSERIEKTDLTPEFLNDLPSLIIQNIQKTTRPEDVKLIKSVFNTMPRESIINDGKVMFSPYLIPRKGRKTMGMTGDLDKLAKKYKIVGVETSFVQLGKDCS